MNAHHAWPPHNPLAHAPHVLADGQYTESVRREPLGATTAALLAAVEQPRSLHFPLLLVRSLHDFDLMYVAQALVDALLSNGHYGHGIGEAMRYSDDVPYEEEVAPDLPRAERNAHRRIFWTIHHGGEPERVDRPERGRRAVEGAREEVAVLLALALVATGWTAHDYGAVRDVLLDGAVGVKSRRLLNPQGGAGGQGTVEGQYAAGAVGSGQHP